MNNKKRILAIAAVICVLSGSMAYAEYDPDKVIDPTNPIMTLSADGEAEDTPRVMNGATLPSVSVKEVNGVKMIPLRSVAEGLGYTVTWKGESRSIDVLKGAQYITMSIDKDEYAFSRRAPQPLGAAPTLVGDSTFVPLSFVDEIIGGYYEENEDGTYKIVNPSIVTVTEVTEGGSLIVEDGYLGTVVVHIGEDTVITAGGKEAKAEDIKAEMVLGIEYSPAMTASLPPQTTAVKIMIENQEMEPEDEQKEEFTFDGEITEISENLVTIGKAFEDEDAMRLVVSDDTVITKGNDKRVYKLEDLKVGMEISGTHSEAMTMSIPPQTAAFTINIKADADVEEGDELEAIEAEGKIIEITEDGKVVIKEDEDDMGVALIVTDETVIKKGNDKRIYKLDDLEVGMKISAKHSPVMTRSIPPQTVAFEITIED
ncbi:MAG TPA: hypothetical protein DD391_02840 [Clostridiales bacterium]|nr:copper amine oxidase N-terminal domain-containing protein [Clostridiales bacterium]HBL81525.1 hypothetical protein [Clostridiales bacterium]